MQTTTPPARPQTMSQKLLARAAGVPYAEAGDILWVDADVAMLDDILGPRIEIADRMHELGLAVRHPERVVVISDHYTPPANARQAAIVSFTREWARENGVTNYYEYDGPCHQVMVEKGHARPGQVVLATDSHTCTYGALGCFGTGIGSTEMAGVLATGRTWLRVPQTMRVEWHGELQPRVMAKDISLATIGHIGHAGATYRTIEYCGSTIAAMPVDGRLCLANMAVEAGAKAGLIAYDAITERYLAGIGITGDYGWVQSDEGAQYHSRYEFDSTSLTPQVACPHEVDNVTAIDALPRTPVTQAYLGSCTGGRYEDMLAAAELLRGKSVAKGVRLLVSPASRAIYNRCLREGLLEVFAEAGAIILPASCGACLGLHSGVLGPGDVCISATNRNFLGRMGSAEASVYLASPASVAAAALTGYIADPRTV